MKITLDKVMRALPTRRSAIGLDIGDRWIKAVQLSGPVSRPRLEAIAVVQRTYVEPAANAEEAPAATTATKPPAADGKAQGDEPAKPSMAFVPLTEHESAVLWDALQRRGFAGRRVVTAAPARAALTGILDLPPRNSGAPLDQIARTELAHTHRREPHAMATAFWELPPLPRAGNGLRAMVAGCEHGDAEALLSGIDRSGLQPVAMDVQGWAIARACRPAITDTSNIVAAVDLGWNSATLVLLYREALIYERSLVGMGIRGLSAGIQRDSRFNHDVIEYLLRDLGFREAPRDDEGDWKLLSKARGHMEAHFASLAQELRLSMSYAQHQYPDAPVGHVIITGGGAGIPGLADKLGQQLETQVLRLAPADLFECPEALKEEAADPSLMIAAGLALWEQREATCRAA